MGQKTNAINLRVGFLDRSWASTWYPNKEKESYGLLLANDFLIRKYIHDFFHKKGVFVIKNQIYRRPHGIEIALTIYIYEKKEKE